MAALRTSRKGIIFIISDGVLLDIKARMQPAGTWECYCQIHYHLHTESRCSAKKDAIFPRILILEGFLIDLSIYHVEVVPIPGLDGAVLGRDPLLHPDLQLGHRFLLRQGRHNHQQQQTHKPHSL